MSAHPPVQLTAVSGHPYELPQAVERFGAPYELPDLGLRRICSTRGWDDLAIAGDLYAARWGYADAARCLTTSAGMMLSGWEITGDFLGLGHFASQVSRSVSRAVAPIVRTATHAAAALVQGVRKLDPVAIAKMVAIKGRALAGSVTDSVAFHLLRGVADRMSAPFLKVIRTTVSPLIPYVQAVVSFVPSVGTGVSAALGAAQALADGKSIDEMAIAAARGAIPGGPLAQSAFDIAAGLVRGKPLDTTVLSALRERVPGVLGKRAFDVGIAMATAKTAQDRRNVLQWQLLTAAAQRLPAGFPRVAGTFP